MCVLLYIIKHIQQMTINIHQCALLSLLVCLMDLEYIVKQCDGQNKHLFLIYF